MDNDIKEMPQIDTTLEYSLEDFMEAYKIVDEDKVYSNGIEYVPIFRVKQWLDYNNITDLQEERDMFERMSNWACKNMFAYKSRIDKANEIIDEVLFVGVKDYRSQLEIIQKVINGGDE